MLFISLFLVKVCAYLFLIVSCRIPVASKSDDDSGCIGIPDFPAIGVEDPRVCWTHTPRMKIVISAVKLQVLGRTQDKVSRHFASYSLHSWDVQLRRLQETQTTDMEAANADFAAPLHPGEYLIHGNSVEGL